MFSKIILIFSLLVIFNVPSHEGKPVLEKETETRFLGLRTDLFQGDIMLKDGILPKNGMSDPRYRWPSGIIIYELDPAFTASERAVIAASMAEFPAVSCVRFQQRTNQNDYVYIVRGSAGSGCWAYVGRNGGRQEVNLEAPGCIISGPTGHELMHAVGFHHEHCRMDRDDYMRILWENIRPEYYSAFDKIPGTTTFGFPYDYQSIMQYPGWGFSSNGKDTMVPIPTPVPLGQYKHLTVEDGQKMNAMYAGYCN
jgi:hypothetical protein